MSIVVTGATDHLGRLAVEELLRRGVPAEHVLATGRNTEALPDLAGRGVTVRRADYDYDYEASVRAAFAGAERLLLVSGSEVGQRIRQHTNAVRAATDAGIGFVAYTSVAKRPPRRCRSAPSTAPPRRCSPNPASRTSCSATAGTPRTTPASSPPT